MELVTDFAHLWQRCYQSRTVWDTWIQHCDGVGRSQSPSRQLVDYKGSLACLASGLM